MPAGVSWTSYLKMFAASLLAMCAGAEVVHRYYRPDLSSGTEQPLGAAQVTPSPRCLNLYGSKKNCCFSLKSAAMPSEYTFIVVSILPSRDCSPSYSCMPRTGRRPSPYILV
ncbi:ubiquinol-cytochrome c reductase complex assembly factor 6 isoform X1 [Eschrichtius robustus]|uniref:ubiquinol-cytochrome c reductase complex assembly factor 6 isoform X1 n=1 Tax=Eschrichtius robustus TaxID=9764 RepID=UPI0035C1C69E